MKKILTIILSVLIAIVPLAGCNNNNQPSKTLELSQEVITLSLFGEKELIANVSDNSDVVWSNSNATAVKIVEKGNSVNVIAIGAGTSVITAKVGDLTDTCNVSVAATTETLALSVEGRDALELRVGAEGYIPTKVSFGGQEFSKAVVKFTSANTDIAEVSADGIVTAKVAGSTTIKVVAEFEGNYSNEVEVSVNVSAGPLVKVNASYLSLYATKEEVDPLQFPTEKQFNVAIIDGSKVTEITDYTVEYTTEGVATLSNGVIDAVKKGNTQVKIICNYLGVEYFAIVYVEVKELPKVSISLVQTSIDLVSESQVEFFKTSAQLDVSATLDGKDVADSDIYWTVDQGQDVVTVTKAGLVKSVVAGNAVVSANYDFAGKTYKASCNVNVSDITLDGALVKVEAGNSLVIEDVDYQASSTDSLVRFQYIPPVEYTGDRGLLADAAPYGPEMIYVTIQDAEDFNSYVTVGIRRYKGDRAFYKSARVGARASTWGALTTGLPNQYDTFYGFFEATNNPTHWATAMGVQGGYATYAAFSFYGGYLFETENVDNYKIGISLDGSKVYMQNDGTNTLVWDFAVSGQVNKATWDGIKSGKVNIFLTFDYIQHGYGSGYFAIDKLAGETITSNSDVEFTTEETSGVVIPAAYK